MVYALLIDEPDGFVDRAKFRSEVDAHLRGPVAAASWGETPEAISAQEAFMNLGNA